MRVVDAARAYEDEALTLDAIAAHVGDISGMLSASDVARIGHDVRRDYEIDLADREPWAKVARSGLDAAAQCLPDVEVTFPFSGAANTHFPILTIACLQFNARAYPAIFKGGEVVSVKVIGKDTDGIKSKRAARVREYLNTVFSYRMKDWEADTDLMLMQLPIVGMAFRKIWWDGRKGCSGAGLVPALRMVVPMSARSLEVAPRVTEHIDDLYPYQIRQRQRTGFYRAIDLPAAGDDDEAPRKALEQHRLMDLDDDGIDEPYVITLDMATDQVLRIEPAFGVEDIEYGDDGQVIDIKRRTFYVAYTFFPDPKGGFYGLGFGHFLTGPCAVIDTIINQTLDAGQAAIAGGGFMSSGIRMQGAGQSAVMEWSPGEYKVVSGGGGDLRAGIYERTFPNTSPVMFQLLDLMLGAARDIAAIKDVTSGDASNQGQVGTTLALIEQGLQVFTAIYKRIYRSLRDEFQQVYANIAAYGSERTAEDYRKVLDDREADFAADFNAEDMDIRPVSDPGSVTRMQKMARAGFLDAQRGKGMDDMEINRRLLEAADIEDIDKLLPAPPEGPNPIEVAALEKVGSEVARNNAQAAKALAEAAVKGAEIGMTIGEADAIAGIAENAAVIGGEPERMDILEGPPDNPLGDGGDAQGGGFAAGGMDGPIMGPGGVQPG